jgi:hypothetical protein
MGSLDFRSSGFWALTAIWLMLAIIAVCQQPPARPAVVGRIFADSDDAPGTPGQKSRFLLRIEWSLNVAPFPAPARKTISDLVGFSS